MAAQDQIDNNPENPQDDERDSLPGVGGESNDIEAGMVQPENVEPAAIPENPIDNNFAINFNEELDLSSDFCKAYAVSGKKFGIISTGGPEMYALVFDKAFPVRSDIIKYIQSLEDEDPILPAIQDIGLVKIPSTGLANYAMILEKPPGQSLRELFLGSPPAEKFFLNNIFTPLYNSIGKLSENGVVHGNLNIDNIYFDPTTEKIYLGECFSGPCGYRQPALYEPIERAQCHNYAKGDKDTSTDYFALGIIVLFMLTGKLPLSDMGSEEIIETRLFKNSFLTLVGNLKPSTAMGELLRGLLADRSERRWGYIQVDNWLRNKSNQTSSSPPKEAMRGFILNDKEYFNCRSLVYAMNKDLEKVKTSLKVADLGRWLKHSLLNPQMAERFESLPFHSRMTETVHLENSDVYKIMAILDPTGPIRYGGYQLNIHGIGSFLAHAFSTSKRDHIQLVGDMFNSGLVNFWGDLATPVGDDDDPRINKLPWETRKISKLMRNPNLGFGIERAMYEMNRSLPCLSPILSQHYVTDLKDLLSALDTLAKDSPKDLVDRQIAAYIASKIDLRDDINIRNIAEFEFVAKSSQILILAFLVAAQTQSRSKNLRNLTSWMADKLAVPLAKLHGSTLKKDMVKNLKRVGREGDLGRILNFVSNPDYLKKDRFSFKEATRYYRELSDRITLLQHQENTERMAYEYGLRIALAIGYAVCSATLLYLLSGI